MVDTPATFAALWKGTNFSNPRMNRNPLPAGSPLVNTPRTASSSLIRQATQKIWKGQDRKKVMAQLVTSTMRRPAAVRPPPAPAPAPSPAAAAPSSGFGGAGYSGANATILGQQSNPGWTTPAR